MASSTAPCSANYEIPSTGKIKLKETKADKAERLYRREQKRQRREDRKINRANGYAVSPPRTDRPESISPPRNPPKPSTSVNDEDFEDEQSSGYRWMGGIGRSAREDMERMEEEARMSWMEHEEMFRSNPFGSFNGPFTAGFSSFDAHIPLRFRQAAGPSRPVKRDAAREVRLDGGAVPDIGMMGEEEYAEWVRDGMYRLKNKAEVERQERARKDKLEKERLREAAAEKAKKEEKKRIDKLRREKGREEENKKKTQRDRYRLRWTTITDTGGEIEEAELTFDDVPWPIYKPSRRSMDIEDLSKDAVRSFFQAMASDIGESGDEYKKILRDAIRSFHPDRFFGRILPRVADKEKEMVKEGVERCSRVINDLAAELRNM